MKDNPVFLLGGADLEMAVIKHALIRHGFRVEDAGLGWSDAHLSSYAEILLRYDRQNTHFVGIELCNEDGFTPPPHYTLVDHHGAETHKPSSLEQVYAMIGIEKMSLFEHAVAANDAHFISGMLKLGLGQKHQIPRIRKLDNCYKGVTVDEWSAAERAAHEVLKDDAYYDHPLPMVIRTELNRPELLSELIVNVRPMIVCNDLLILYFGRGIETLRRTLVAHDIGLKLFSGGASDPWENGFLGIDLANRPSDNVQALIEYIVHLYQDNIAHTSLTFQSTLEIPVNPSCMDASEHITDVWAQETRRAYSRYSIEIPIEPLLTELSGTGSYTVHISGTADPRSVYDFDLWKFAASEALKRFASQLNALNFSTEYSEIHLNTKES